MSPPAPPLVIRLGAIGDLILITPLLRALSAKYGQPCEVVARGNWPPKVFSELPFIAGVKTVSRKNVPYPLASDHRRLVRWLRTRNNGPVYLLETDPKSYQLLERAQVKITNSCSAVVRQPNEHIARYLARVCGFSAEDKLYDPFPVLRVNGQEQAECNAWLERLQCYGPPLVLVQAGSLKSKFWWRTNKKEWSLEKWMKVIRQVLECLPEGRVLLCGTERERHLTVPLAKRLGDSRVFSVAGDLALRRFFALLRVSHSMISVDTGPAHAAAASGCPLVVLFGKTDPRDIGPVGSSPVIIVTGPPGAPEPDGKIEWAKHHSMDGISVDSVTKAWCSLNV